MTPWVLILLILPLIPALLYFVNLCFYRPMPQPLPTTFGVSVLIPARNEERSIGPALEAVLASRGVEWEAIVLDDQSADATAAIVQEYATRDPRVTLATAPPLPAGWCGKQHACFALSQLARYDRFCFVDADVRLLPDGLARMVSFQELAGADLVSGIPHQETGTFWERLIIPLIHWVLLGFLPMVGMRYSRWSAFSAGCGQLFLTRRSAYHRIGGHEAVRTSLHDGITLPRAYRQAGATTDMRDATDIATCRMYRSGGELWAGLAKNAREGMAANALIGPFTLLLFGGQVLPLIVLPFLDMTAWGIAIGLIYLPRCDAAWRFRQSWLGVILHPLGILALLGIQWYAIVRAVQGRPVGWKGRAHPSRTPSAED